MNRIDERFAKVKADGRKALITFLTVGDPNMEVSEKAIYTMQEEGVDLIELGVPFSDPAADGPVIQRADERALAQGVDIFKVFELVRKIRNNVEVPMVFLLYYNVMVQYGIEKFFKRCQETGVDGLITQDLALVKICRECCPDLEYHASTQMTIHSESGVKTAKNLGFSRAVLSRELPEHTIKDLTVLGIETEVFAHRRGDFPHKGIR